MQINRSVAKTKEVVYTVVDGSEKQYEAVIDELHILHIVYPYREVTRPHQRVMDKLITKAKARDGIKAYTLHKGCKMEQGPEEMLISPLSVEEPA